MRLPLALALLVLPFGVHALDVSAQVAGLPQASLLQQAVDAVEQKNLDALLPLLSAAFNERIRTDGNGAKVMASAYKDWFRDGARRFKLITPVPEGDNATALRIDMNDGAGKTVKTVKEGGAWKIEKF